MKKYAAYGIGAALVDTEIKVTDGDLQQMNVDKGLMTLVDEARQEELLGHLSGQLVKAVHASGGSAGNSMIATAQFGAPTFMSCKVAADMDGDIYLADLARAGVDHCLDGERESGTTGKCLVMITPDAERSMNTFLGISETLSPAQLNADAIAASEYFYIESYLATSPTGLAAAVKGRELAQAAGVKTAVSFSDEGIVQHFREGVSQILGAGIDLIFCNASEAQAWGETDSLDIAIERLKQVAKAFVVTQGAEGAVVFDGKDLISIPPHRVNAVDTNGAGDMFAGAFLYSLNRGEDFATAGRFASLAAGKIVSQYGPRLAPEDYPSLRVEFFGE
ncbi:MAG: adenosine kinase [Pseudomonadota bacterium]